MSRAVVLARHPEGAVMEADFVAVMRLKPHCLPGIFGRKPCAVSGCGISAG